MMRLILPLLLAFGIAAVASAQDPAGAGGGGAYSATVPVAGTSDAQRAAAISDAFAEVLANVAPGFGADPSALGKASGYVRDYHYRRAAGGGLELQVDFDPGAVGRLVATAGTAPAAQPGSATSAEPAATGGGGTGTLWVGGVDNSHAFAELLSTLRGDPALHDVTPVGTSGEGVLLQVTSDQPLAGALESLTGPGGHFADQAQPHQGADASLRWVP